MTAAGRLFVTAVVILTAVASQEEFDAQRFKTVLSSDSDVDIEDLLDDIIQDLEEKYSGFEADEFWHPYIYGTGNENRELLHVKDVATTEVEGDYIQWKYARLGLKHYLIGLQRNQIDVLGSDFKVISSLSLSGGEAETFIVFTRWNEAENRPEMIIVTVDSEPKLNLYSFEDNSIKPAGVIPLHYHVKGIEFCHVGQSSKVVLIPKDPATDIDIYNVEIHNSTQVWFFQRIASKNNVNIVVYDSDMLESVIAVAGNKELDIYTYDAKAGLFIVSQEIGMPNECQSLFSFTVAYQHYIGCVPIDPNTTVSFVSFNYNRNEYVLEQEDASFKDGKIVGVYPIAVPEYTDQYFTLTYDVEGITRIMVYHGRKSGFQIEYNCTMNETSCPENTDISKGVGFRQKDKSAFIFPSGDQGQKSTVWLISKELRDSSSPLVDESRQLYKTYNELSQRFEQWENTIEKIEKTLNNSVKVDEPNTVEGTWTVESISSQSLSLQGVDRPTPLARHFEFVGSEWTDDDFTTDLKKINAQINSLKMTTKAAKEEVDNAVFVDSDFVQRVTATQHVLGKFQADHLTAANITTNSINEDETSVFLDAFVPKTEKIVINGGLEFENITTITHLTAQLLDDLPVDHIARYSQANVFECPLNFTNGLTSDGSVIVETINGANFAEEILMASDIFGVEFEDGFVISNNTNANTDYSFENVLLKSSKQVVKSQIYFETVQTQSLDVININEYQFDEFVSSIVTTDYAGTISGRKVAASDSIHAKWLDIGTTWNNASFPNSFIRNKQNRVVFNKTTTFDKLTANKASIDGHLDGVMINDLVTRTNRKSIRPEDIPANWTFTGPVTIIKDIMVTGLVDGVELAELANKDNLNDNRDIHVYGDVEFEQDISFDILNVNSSINDQEFEDVFGNLLIFNGTKCDIPGLTTVASNVTLDMLNVTTGVANNQNLSSFFLINGDQNVTGDLIIYSKTNFKSVFALKLFDTVDLDDIVINAVRLVGANKILWNASFEHIKCSNSASISSPINGQQNFENNAAVISGKPSQVFLSSVLFTNLTLNSTAVMEFNMTDNQKLGGLGIANWYQNRLSLVENELIERKIVIDGLVKASHDIFTPSFNNVSLKTLSNTAFRSDMPLQIFKENVKFNSSISIEYGNIILEDDLSGFNLDDITNNAFPLNAKDTEILKLSGIWHFESIAVNGNLNVFGKTCGVNLEELQTNSVRKDQKDIRIPSGKNFSDMTVGRQLRSSTLNGKDTNDLFTLHTNQTIKCPFKVHHNLKIDKNLTTDGDINGVPAKLLTESYSMERGTHIINSDFQFDSNFTTKKFKVKGNIQGRNFSDAASNTEHLIKIDDTGLKFIGTKTFLSPVSIKSDSTAKLYNALEPEKLQFKFLQDDWTVKTPIKFLGTVKTPTIKVTGGGVTAVKVVGLLWDDVIRESIPISIRDQRRQKINHLTFDRIIVDKHIHATIFQGRPFSDLILLKGRQSIQHLQVKKIKLSGKGITVYGLLNGHNMTDIHNNVVQDDGSDFGEIWANKSFIGSWTVEGDFNCFGEELRDNVIDITQPFDIDGPIEFKKPVHVEKEINVPGVHGYTIDDLTEDALATSGDQTIIGFWKFDNGVTFQNDVEGPGKLKNFDYHKVMNETAFGLRAAQNKVEGQKSKFIDECKKVHSITGNLKFGPMKLDAFDRHQTIGISPQVQKILTVQSSKKLLLLATDATCGIQRYEFMNTTEMFSPISSSHNLNFGRIVKWESTTHHRTGGIVSFLIEFDDCSPLSSGLHYVIVHPSGTFSPPYSILSTSVTDFKIISNYGKQHTAIFTIGNDSVLHVYMWDTRTSRFTWRRDFHTETEYHHIDATLHRDGVVILLSSEQELGIYDFNWSTSKITELRRKFVEGLNSTQSRIFENYGDLYTLLPRRATQLSAPQSSSSLEVYNVIGSDMIKLQQLPLSDVIHKSVINFSHQVFVSILSKTYGLNIYKFQGLSGLTRLNENPIKVFNGISLVNFEVKAWDFSAPRSFIAVLTTNTIEIYHSNVYGDSLDSATRDMCNY